MSQVSFRLALLAAALIGLSGCGQQVEPANLISTSVAPLKTDDLARPCTYDLALPLEAAPQAAVLVIFERGDSLTLFEDPDLRAATTALHISTVFAHECDAISSGDLQSDATKGPQRTLFTALTQFASATSHPEFAQSKVILYGFSAAGALAMTMTEAAPDRVMAAIPYAPGSAYLDLATVSISEPTTHVPMLIMANAMDPVVGTARNYLYYKRGHTTGAPWVYAVQNATGHCCNASTKSMILPWIKAVASGVTPSQTTGSAVGFQCQSNGFEDSYGTTNCSFTTANVGAPATRLDDSGWMPDTASAQAWLTWVTNPQTN